MMLLLTLVLLMLLILLMVLPLLVLLLMMTLLLRQVGARVAADAPHASVLHAASADYAAHNVYAYGVAADTAAVADGDTTAADAAHAAPAVLHYVHRLAWRI